MKKHRLFTIIGILVILCLVVPRQVIAQEEYDDLCYNDWYIPLSLELNPGYWEPGPHEYYIQVNENGMLTDFDTVYFDVVPEAELYDGQVMLRYFSAVTYPRWTWLNEINPSQDTVFQIVYVAFDDMNRNEAQEWSEGFSAKVSWDGGYLINMHKGALMNGCSFEQDNFLFFRYWGPSYIEFPWIRVHPVWDSVDAWNWPEDNILQLTIDDPNTKKKPDFNMSMSGSDKIEGSVWFELTDYDLKTGDIVTIRAGSLSKTITVSNLTINSWNVESNIVYGSAAPGVTVYLPLPSLLIITADGDGNWEADFGSEAISHGTMLAEEYDTDEDLTSYEVWIP
jgi:hypothetical protein